MIAVAGWIAPIATMIAAMMTASNLGARVTGWGFVVFMVGSICWAAVGLESGQTNLLATNAFLTCVNLVGVWRWLGRQRAYEDGGRSAATASRRSAAPTLFTATGIAGLPVQNARGEQIATAVEAMLECETGSVSYVVIARGGVGGIAETLHAVDRRSVRFSCEKCELLLDASELEDMPALPDGAWPSSAPRRAMASAQR